jgi:predicted transcriptional regulator
VARTLLHALFPVVRAEVLQLLFTNPRQELYVQELARLSFLSLQTVQDELGKLHAAQLIVSRTNGYHRFYRANSKHPLYTTLRRLVIKGALHPKPVTRTRQTPVMGASRGGKIHRN